MATTKLSKEGKDFIRSKCKGSGKSKLRGDANDKGGYKYNPEGVLPYCSPLTAKGKQWISNPLINGGVNTNAELAEALIKWYNKYAEEYEMDANIMAAQAYQESLWIIWNYAVNSSASGISQFVAGTFYEVLIKNKRKDFTDAELIALTQNMVGYTYTPGSTPPENPFLVKYTLGKKNRPFLHQNIIDNPEIMIKAQFSYMKWISTRCDKMASCSLFGYNRGPYLTNSSSYSAWIAAAKSRSNNYENEGIIYVYRIFKLLYNNFGYTKLNINDVAAANFSSFNTSLG